MGLDLDVIPTRPFGIHTAQSWRQIDEYLDLIDTYSVGLFVELGVDRGGLASVMIARALFNPNFWYVGIDKNTSRIEPNVFAATRTVGRCSFQETDLWSPETVMWVQMTANQVPGPVFILCDGGDKPKEMSMYAPILRTGDIIAAHDWGAEIFERDVKHMVDGDHERIGLATWRKL